MNLLHLRYFHEVVRCRSFVEAARTLRVSQPAISKMVKLLEEDVGHPLLERNRSGPKLTEEGEILFQSASRIFSEVQEASEKLSARRQGRDRRLGFVGEWNLGASDNLAIHMVPKALGRFKERNPELRVGLFSGTSSQIKNELHYDRCRLGIFFTPLKASEPFEAKQIHQTEFWIVIRRSNRWLKKGSPSLDDLRRLHVPRIESRHADYSSGFPAHFHSRRLGLTEAPWLEVNQHEVKKKLVLDGHGFALLTRHTVEDEVKSGELLRVKVGQPLSAPIYAVWKKGREPGQVSEAFLEELSRAWRS